VNYAGVKHKLRLTDYLFLLLIFQGAGTYYCTFHGEVKAMSRRSVAAFVACEIKLQTMRQTTTTTKIS